MKQSKTIVLLVFLCLCTLHALAQKGYKIQFHVNGLKDTICLIGNYYGNNTYIQDTVKLDNSGRCTYSAAENFPRGMYIFIITEKNYLDFIINNDKEFSIEADKVINPATMTIKGSPENSLFYDYLKYNQREYIIGQNFQKELEKHSRNADSARMLTDSIKKLNKATIDYRLTIVKQYPESFLAFMINIMKEPEIPEVPILSNGRKDSVFAYWYYRDHYWDDVSFTDDRALRTPVFHNKLVKYFNKILPQYPDTIISEADFMIEKSRLNPEMFKYMVWFFTQQYENSEIMGFDKIFVHIVKAYYMTNQTPWVNETVKNEIIKKAVKEEAVLLGKRPPNMIMQDTSFQPVSMYTVNAKTLILLFWDPDCGHCEQEIPKLKSFYDKNRGRFGLEIYAVCADTSMVKMRNSIKKKQMNWINVNGPRTLSGDYHGPYDITSTPVIYILNEQKVIIAKKLAVEQIEGFLENYYKDKDKK